MRNQPKWAKTSQNEQKLARTNQNKLMQPTIFLPENLGLKIIFFIPIFRKHWLPN